MSQYSHLPIFQKSYKLNLEIYKATRQFPRAFKYTLGQTLKELATDLLNEIVAANQAEQKVDLLKNARLKLEQFRIHLRLACDLRIVSLGRYEALNRDIEEVSKQLSGWLAWASKKSQRYSN